MMIAIVMLALSICMIAITLQVTKSYSISGRNKFCTGYCKRRLSASNQGSSESDVIRDSLDKGSSLLVSDVSSFGINTALAEEHISLGNLENAQILATRAMEIAKHTKEESNIYSAYAEGILANALYLMGSYKESAEHYRKSLQTYEKHSTSSTGPEAIELAGATQLIAWTLLSAKKYDEAQPACKAALAMTEMLLGPDAPDVGASLVNLATSNVGLGELTKQTEALYKRALSIYKTKLDAANISPMDNHLSSETKQEFLQAIGGIHTSLGNLYHLRGDEKDAEVEYRIVESMYLSGVYISSEVAYSFKNLAIILWKRRDLQGAELLLGRALLAIESSPGYGTLHPLHSKLQSLLFKLRSGELAPETSDVKH